MNRVSIYQIPVTADALAAAIETPSIPSALVEPMQAMVAALVHRTTEGPVRLYVCADDELSAARDGFAAVFARALSVHVPSTLVVDCDFLKIGLHGLVPQPDALGLLDFLLYGSSIGVVTQEQPAGLRVVGAGSFPVTKRMPVVESAFADAARRLAAHARCVVLVGPARSEDGTAHPIASNVDLALVVRGEEVARRPRAAGEAGALEESIAADGAEVWSLRTGVPERKPVPAPAPVASGTSTKPTPANAPPRPAAPRVEPPPAPARPRAAQAGAEATAYDAPESRYSSLVPRIAVLVFAVLVVAFVSWWVWQGRARDQEETHAPIPASARAPEVGTAAVDSAVPAQALADSAPRDTSPLATVPTQAVSGETRGATGGTVLVDPNDILVMGDLEARWRDWYAIHISSFQESIRAREEVSFLQSREFPVFIVFLDLGAKGKWYRVYAGPFRTREEARDVKKNLDAIPQVRFTRITKIPE